MSNKIPLYLGRLNVITCNLGIDITGDTITSEIRERESQDSELIVAWDVTVDDAPTGMITLTILSADTDGITHTKGFMDIKRLSGSEPIPVFDEALVVEIKGTVTA